ncbi:MAG: DUF192 domain-containing protein [Hyphomonadaceae bacterium]|nr:DUF192 domain-containing protein [Hyphomonadaceae bacterium]
MKKLILSLSILTLMPIAGLALAQEGPAPLDFGPRESLIIQSGDKTHEFSVEIADTREEQARGLMFRNVIQPDEGMLFEFGGDEVRSIWMKNTSVFLDVLFVRSDGRVLKIEHSAKPYSLRSITSEAPVAAVLEIAGGQANEREIKPGDRIQHDFFK